MCEVAGLPEGLQWLLDEPIGGSAAAAMEGHPLRGCLAGLLRAVWASWEELRVATATGAEGPRGKGGTSITTALQELLLEGRATEGLGAWLQYIGALRSSGDHRAADGWMAMLCPAGADSIAQWERTVHKEHPPAEADLRACLRAQHALSLAYHMGHHAWDRQRIQRELPSLEAALLETPQAERSRIADAARSTRAQLREAELQGRRGNPATQGTAWQDQPVQIERKGSLDEEEPMAGPSTISTTEKSSTQSEPDQGEQLIQGAAQQSEAKETEADHKMGGVEQLRERLSQLEGQLAALANPESAKLPFPEVREAFPVCEALKRAVAAHCTSTAQA